MFSFLFQEAQRPVPQLTSQSTKLKDVNITHDTLSEMCILNSLSLTETMIFRKKVLILLDCMTLTGLMLLIQPSGIVMQDNRVVYNLSDRQQSDDNLTDIKCVFHLSIMEDCK